jgi:hypothetical protein
MPAPYVVATRNVATQYGARPKKSNKKEQKNEKTWRKLWPDAKMGRPEAVSANKKKKAGLSPGLPYENKAFFKVFA